MSLWNLCCISFSRSSNEQCNAFASSQSSALLSSNFDGRLILLCIEYFILPPLSDCFICTTRFVSPEILRLNFSKYSVASFCVFSWSIGSSSFSPMNCICSIMFLSFIEIT